ncbi:DUF7718 family protein [Natronomonas sp. EA1]|uniref:DUF7718 family protein n=1 Tax=Natronomonas sp. EA1 TaxID=3421655 RepID=UPI003EBA128B
MAQSDFYYQYTATERRGINYIIGVRLDPDENNVESFAVILFFRLADGTDVEVCKVDNSPHEGEPDIHADRYYRAMGADIKDFRIDIESWHEAENYLSENAERFADKYYDNHGGEPRDDGKNV